MIRLERIARHYGGVAALDGVDLETGPGETILLAGPNGAGKTTLLRLLALLIRPTAGDYTLFGAPARRGADPVALRGRIGFLAHQSWLYDHLTAAENLRFHAGLHARPFDPEALDQALERVGLRARRDDPVRVFSRGMQQRLALARVLLHEPELLLLDEPFTGLDRDGARRLRARLADRPGARTTLIATHDFAEAWPLATRVVILAGGRVAVDRPAAGLDPAGLEALYRAATDGAAGA